jgi:hypothetical protein
MSGDFMATDDATIMGSESHLNEEWTIVKMCGIKVRDYIEDEHILTRELFEKHFDEIVKYVQSSVQGDYVAHQVLGYLILKTGSNLPEHLRDNILNCASWELEKEFWSQVPSWEKPRKFFLNDFITKIKNHVPGIKTLLARDYPEDPDYVYH